MSPKMSPRSYEPDGPVIVVHTAAQATAALAAAARAGRPVVLASPPDAAASMGPGMFRAMVAAARQAEPRARSLAVLDCGARAGDAMAALREGIEAVCFRGDKEVAAKLADMAEQSGARLLTALDAALDLTETREPEEAVLALLSS
jgi:acyl-CoA reductase-like NAD-dependent aldehyde dehydrogenase